MTRGRGLQADERPQPPHQARSAGVPAGQPYLDRGAVGQAAGQPDAAGSGQFADSYALTCQPGREPGLIRQHRRRAEEPAHQPSGQQPAEQHDHHGEGRQRVHGQPADQQRRTRRRPPAGPVRTPGQVGADHERDERSVHHENRRIAVVQHGALDRAVLGPPDARRGQGPGGTDEPGGDRVAHVPPLIADQHHHGDDRQDEAADPGDDLGRELQPGREMRQPARDIVGQLRAAQRERMDGAEHHRDDREREHREQQVSRTAHPARAHPVRTHPVRASPARAGQSRRRSALRHNSWLPGVIPRTPTRRRRYGLPVSDSPRQAGLLPVA